MSYKNMTDQEIAEALAELHAVRDLREQLERAEEDKVRIAAQVDELLMQLQQLNGVQAGGEWVPPTSASGAYPLGAVVTHKGHTWENIVASNPHEPGVSGWAIVPEVDPETGEDVPPPYVQPAGNHDSYQAGGRITWSDGLVYEAVRSGVVHSPDEYAADWRLVEEDAEPEPEPEQEEPPEGEEPTDPEEPEPGDGDEDEDDEPEPEPEEDLPGEWVQPGGHNPYNTGDRVLWQGSVYESVMDGNVWSPAGHPQGWTKVS